MLCWMANPAAGVIRSSHSPAPAGSREATASTYGSTRTTMAVVTAAAVRRMIAPTATARAAATASSNAVPATTRTQVSGDTGNT
jgi:hypothetical protein